MKPTPTKRQNGGKMHKTRRMRLAIVSALIAWTICYGLPSSAQESRVELAEGEVAPWSGVLLSEAALAQVRAEIAALRAERDKLRDGQDAAEDEIESLRAALREREVEALSLRAEAGMRESIAMMQAEHAARCEQRQLLMIIGAGAALVLSQR